MKASGCRRIGSERLALALMNWNDGQWSGIYSVASCMFAGVAVERNQVQRALDELHRDFKNFELFSKRQRSELKSLAKQLKESWLAAE